MSPRALQALTQQWRELGLARLPLVIRPVTRNANAQRWVCQSCQQEALHIPPSRILDQTLASRFISTRNATRRSIGPRSLSARRLFATASQLQKDAERIEKSFASSEGLEQRVSATQGVNGNDKTREKIQRFVEITRNSWNDVVGYTEIEKEKQRVERQEELIEKKRLELQEARDAYRSAVDKHATSLRESRDMLARKDEWSERDAGKFGALHTAVKANEQAEYVARKALQAAELALEREIERLSSKIGAVYQAESMYNSKILQMKTWWTWALFLFNGSIFVFNLYLLQIGLSPRYQAKIELSDETITQIRTVMADSVLKISGTKISSHVHEVLAPTIPDASEALGTLFVQDGTAYYKNSKLELESEDIIATLKHKIQMVEHLPAATLRLVQGGKELEDEQTLANLQITPEQSIEIFFGPSESSLPTFPAVVRQDADSSTLESLKTRGRALFSDQAITLQMKEMTYMALQGAVAGAAMAGLILLNWRKG